MLELVGADVSGVRVEDLVERILGKDFYDNLRALAVSRCKVPRDFFRSLGIDAVPSEDASSALRKEIGMLAPNSEFRLCGHERLTPPGRAARAFAALSVLYGKWRGAGDDEGFTRVSAQAGAGYWLGSTFPLFDKWVRSAVTWSEAIRSLVILILSQHYGVMRERRKPDSLWVHFDGDLVIKEQDYQSTPRTTRHLNAVNILLDLLLLEEDDDRGLTVTEQGRRLLQEVLG